MDSFRSARRSGRERRLPAGIFSFSLCACMESRREGEGSAGWKPALPAGECSTLASCRERRFLVKRAGQVRILREDADEEGVDSGALLVRHYSTVSQLMAMAGAAIRR